MCNFNYVPLIMCERVITEENKRFDDKCQVFNFVFIQSSYDVNES